MTKTTTKTTIEEGIQRFRVFWETPDNFGWQKSDIKWYTEREDAISDIKKRKDELQQDFDAGNFEDETSVVLEDLLLDTREGYILRADGVEEF